MVQRRHILKVLFSRAYILELNRHLYQNTHSVVVFSAAKHTHNEHGDGSQRSGQMQEKELEQTQRTKSIPPAKKQDGSLSEFRLLFVWGWDSSHTKEKALFKSLWKETRRQHRYLHAGCQEPSHHSSPGGRECSYKTEKKGNEKLRFFTEAAWLPT